jgi:hypothetical protein
MRTQLVPGRLLDSRITRVSPPYIGPILKVSVHTDRFLFNRPNVLIHHSRLGFSTYGFARNSISQFLKPSLQLGTLLGDEQPGQGYRGDYQPV